MKCSFNKSIKVIIYICKKHISIELKSYIQNLISGDPVGLLIDQHDSIRLMQNNVHIYNLNRTYLKTKYKNKKRIITK